MKSISLPDKVENALSALVELARRAVDGTVKPLFVDYDNQRVGANTSAPDHPLCVSSTAGFHSDILVTGSSTFAVATATTLSLNSLTASGNIFLGPVTAGTLTVTGATDLYKVTSVTGQFSVLATAAAASSFVRFNNSGGTTIFRVREDDVAGVGQMQNVLSQSYFVVSSQEGEDSQLEFQADGGDDAADIATIRKAPGGDFLFTNGNSQTDSAAHFRISSANLVDTLTTGNFFSAVNVTGRINSTGDASFLGVTGSSLVVTGSTDLAGVTASTIQLETALGGVGNAMVKNTLYADNIIKAWGRVNQSAETMSDSFNLDALTNVGTGQDTITFSTDFANGNYSAVNSTNGATQGNATFGSFAAGTVVLSCYNDAGNLSDHNEVGVLFVGDQ